MECKFTIDCPGRRLDLTWFLFGTEGRKGGAEAIAVQEFALPFWPTAVGVMDEKHILVAGKARSGSTRIELWELAPPTISVAQPSGKMSLTPQPVVSRIDVYDAGVVGKDMVQVIFRNRGKANHAFVQFGDSLDLYELDWKQAPYPLSKVLDSNQTPGLGDDKYDMFGAGDHSLHGYYYTFGYGLDASSDDPAVEPFALMDYDRNGEIDDALKLPLETFLQLGFGDSTQIVESNGIVY